MKHTGSAVWKGSLKEGKGTVSTESGALSKAKYAFKTRFEQSKGTNPEELIAAAHAGCFSMALSAQLGNGCEAGVLIGKVHNAARPGCSDCPVTGKGGCMRGKSVMLGFIQMLGVSLIVAMLLAGVSEANAQGSNIYEATLGETEPTGEVSTEELRRILVEGSAVVLDSRSRAQYAAGHVPGAKNIDLPSNASPSEYLAAVEHLLDGDKGKALVLYCNGPKCGASRVLSKRLVEAGFTNVRRYQLGIPIWRGLGGPTEIELDGILQIYQVDRTTVYFDARSPEEFAKGSIPEAHNVPADQLAAGVLDAAPKPRDDFNTRIILFGRDAAQARALAVAMGETAYHNVNYYPGTFASLLSAIQAKSTGIAADPE